MQKLRGAQAVLSQYGMLECELCYRLSCMQKLRSAQAVLSQYGMLECELCCELLYCCQTWQIWVVLYAEGCGVRALLMCSYAIGVNRLMCIVQSFMVCVVGKMA